MPEYKKRRWWKAGAGVLCAGLLYGYVLIPMGLRLSCPFRRLTGLRCPGCGVTEMCLAVLHGRFLEAPGHNWGLARALPVLLWLGLDRLRGGERRRRERTALALAAALLAWGVLRNLTGL